ncbi:hypothetical protein K7432_011553 [Basidiobolus ranarum]|uniref:mRNA decay activator protein ZFP36 n=1 Tax=Basidiobolus ranarum TaxID=34480 RepID=A0ABR2WM63_9FUNG
MFRSVNDSVYSNTPNTYTLFGGPGVFIPSNNAFDVRAIWWNAKVPSLSHTRTNSSSSTLSNLSNTVGASTSEHQILSPSLHECNNTSAGANVNIKNILLYKTELCQTFQEVGECRYGVKCQFAHGLHQLRRIHKHPKHKTKMCRTFWELGRCPYGKRCCFIHHGTAIPAEIGRVSPEGFQIPFEATDKYFPITQVMPNHSYGQYMSH